MIRGGESDHRRREKHRHRSRSRERSRRSRSRSRSRSYSPARRKRKEEKKRRRRSSSSESSQSRSRSHSPRSGTRRHGERSKRDEHARRKEKEEKRKQKELMKAMETPEEKRLRRLAKKEAKERKQRMKEGWDLDYTNANNPFGDHNLMEKFVWHKKREQEASDHNLSKEEIVRREKQRQEEMRREVEKVKKRRIEREKEREAREEEMALLQRMKEAELFKEWESQEDDFHLNQARLRSKIRIETGRAKPIDLLAKYVQSNEEDMDIEVQEPYLLLRGLNVVDLEDLLEDIKVYSEMEANTNSNSEFWSDMITICIEEISKLKKLEESDAGGGQGAQQRGSINSAVADDVAAIFKKKTTPQLVLMEKQINEKIHSSGPGTDVGYWEALLQQLKAFMARARLRDRHQELLKRKLFFLKQQQLSSGDRDADDPPLFPAGGEAGEEEEGEAQDTKTVVVNKDGGEAGPSGTSEEQDTLIDEDDLLKRAYEDYESGAYSPKLLKITDVDDDLIVDPEDDESSRKSNRQLVASGGTLEKVVKEYEKIGMTRNVGADGQAQEEYDFNKDIKLGQQDPIWKEKYKPRKPRFLNRVHTGFEWNKYNQTHYDTDNPPPKIVQGYKFNIFYSDLINKRKTPQYSVTPCSDNPDFAILKFTAGPPYEDIGFKIVNREWECSWKHGFRSQFSNNILQLWFRFKRNRYRR